MWLKNYDQYFSTPKTCLISHLLNIVQSIEESCDKWTNSKITTLLSEFVWTFTYHQDFLFDPNCYKTLSNGFYKSITATKLITSINSKVKMYRFQKNELFGEEHSLPNLSFFCLHVTEKFIDLSNLLLVVCFFFSKLLKSFDCNCIFIEFFQRIYAPCKVKWCPEISPNDNRARHRKVCTQTFGIFHLHLFITMYYCVSMKRIRFCNCLCSSSPSSRFSSSLIRNIREFGAII